MLAAAPRRPPRRFGQLLTEPGFYAPGALQLTPLAAHTLLQLARTPHRYGFAFSALGSAPHLLAFEGAPDFQRARQQRRAVRLRPIQGSLRSARRSRCSALMWSACVSHGWSW